MIRRPPRSPLFPSTPLFRSALLFLGFVVAERRAHEPVLPPRLFPIRNVSAGTAVNLLRAVSFFAIIAYVPLLAASVLGRGSVGVRNVFYFFTSCRLARNPITLPTTSM